MSSPTPSPVNPIGLGCVTFGREIDRATAFAMMDHAAARGVTMFDTAAAYGAGASETIVGEWLAPRADRVRLTVVTKVLPPYTPEALAASVEASFKRLGIQCIDLLLLHRWDASIENEASLHALDQLVRSGRVHTIGASNFNAEQLEGTLVQQTKNGVAPLRALQNIHNLAVRGIDDAILQLAAQHGIALVTYSPLGAGFLTGKHEERVQPGSRFDLIPGHQNVYFNDLARQRLARLKDVSARSGVPMTTLALAWALRQPHGGTVLVGGRTTAQLDQAFAAREFADVALLRELDDA